MATQDITVKSFEINTFRDDQKTDSVQMWTRKGFYKGAELKEVMWQKVMNASSHTFEMEKIMLQLEHPIRMPKNEKRSFYIAIEGDFSRWCDMYLTLTL